jgi:hypothetical protein
MRKKLFILVILVSMLTLLAQGVGLSAPGDGSVLLKGLFTVLWGDGAQDTPGSHVLYFLTTERGQQIRLSIDEDALARSGGALALNRQPVFIRGIWIKETSGGSAGVLQVQSVDLDKVAAQAPEGVFGPKPWISIMCKFADYSDEPNDLAYFQDMYANIYPGLDHFWREQSYDLANMEGSGATGWYVLPHDREYYVPPDQQYMNWQAAAEDCTAVADSNVDFTNYVGINLMFNATLDCCAWGGAAYLCLDGLCQWWMMTWEPPWGYQNIGVLAHETGHGFGLPHSSGGYGQVYDNAWDVMSDLWSNCSRGGVDPVWGCLGQGTISFHKNLLEWIDSTKMFEVPPGSVETITLERLALPQTNNYRGAKVLINGSQDLFYTVEVRQLVGYDSYLPGVAVIIHNVDVNRSEPAHVIDIDGDGDTGDEGAMWLPGEVFTDSENDIKIEVLSATPTGFVVTINNAVVDPAHVQIYGPSEGAVNQDYSFTANVMPIGTTQPLTYYWEATDNQTITHTNGLQDTVTFAWTEPGPKEVHVTAVNAAGEVSDTLDFQVYVPPQSLMAGGPTWGAVDISYTLTATLTPTDTSLPVVYTWEVNGQPPLVHTAGLTDTAVLAWSEPGTQVVTVTASNDGGEVSTQHVISLYAPPESISLEGPAQGAVGTSYTFTATVEPLDVSQPVTYTWEVDGQTVITHSGGLSDSLVLAWTEPGEKVITVTAANLVGGITAEQQVMLNIPPQGLQAGGSEKGFTHSESTFSVQLSPTTTLPVTYVWFVEGQLPITHTGGLSDTFSVQWDTMGTYTVTVLVTNGGGTISYSWEVAVFTRLFLPFTSRK